MSVVELTTKNIGFSLFYPYAHFLTDKGRPPIKYLKKNTHIVIYIIILYIILGGYAKCILTSFYKSLLKFIIRNFGISYKNSNKY